MGGSTALDRPPKAFREKVSKEVLLACHILDNFSSI